MPLLCAPCLYYYRVMAAPQSLVVSQQLCCCCRLLWSMKRAFLTLQSWPFGRPGNTASSVALLLCCLVSWAPSAFCGWFRPERPLVYHLWILLSCFDQALHFCSESHLTCGELF